MSWVSKTSFNPSIKKWSYSKIISVYGEDRGAEVAAHFKVKKMSKKTTTKKGGK